MFRNLLLEQIAKVERGEDPLGVIRDPAKNEPYISIAREGVALRAFEIARDMTRAEDRAAAAEARSFSAPST
jgi:fructose-1,6-bisphosphatase/inositol monophosphatase family enzyme